MQCNAVQWTPQNLGSHALWQLAIYELHLHMLTHLSKSQWITVTHSKFQWLMKPWRINKPQLTQILYENIRLESFHIFFQVVPRKLEDSASPAMSRWCVSWITYYMGPEQPINGSHLKSSLFLSPLHIWYCTKLLAITTDLYTPSTTWPMQTHPGKLRQWHSPLGRNSSRH